MELLLIYRQGIYRDNLLHRFELLVSLASGAYSRSKSGQIPYRKYVTLTPPTSQTITFQVVPPEGSEDSLRIPLNGAGYVSSVPSFPSGLEELVAGFGMANTPC
ncbi:hypothetical protein CIP107570_01937 [Corynebacterium diphtheriae]|nr:hypothetical protein CIP102550_01919 [Corynebacterium diphtheriae]CAB0662699.1 hypothetical protein CIP107570_01937 [Corynebacterium diphtheriae]